MEHHTNTDKTSAALTVFLCFVVAVIEGLDLQAAGIAASGVKQFFSLNPEQLGLFFSAGIFGLLPGTLLGGRYADKFGRKNMLIVSVAVFAVFTLMTAWVNSFHSLLLVRFLAGIGMGAAFPNLIALASEAVSVTNRGRAVALMYCGMPVGALLLSFWVANDPTGSWKSVFYLGGLSPLIVIPLLVFFLKESKEYISVVQQRVILKDNTSNYKYILQGE